MTRPVCICSKHQAHSECGTDALCPCSSSVELEDALRDVIEGRTTYFPTSESLLKSLNDD